jgi:coenzyme F420-reducing hydrogenase gamma subunit
MKQFAVLHLSGCSGCEVSLINAEIAIESHLVTNSDHHDGSS